jgi:hypothetical protein
MARRSAPSNKLCRFFHRLLAGVVTELTIKAGAAHGWADRQPDCMQFAEWFDEHLRGVKA